MVYTRTSHLGSRKGSAGVPVATTAINGSKNAALIAVSILALQDAELAARLEAFRAKQTPSREQFTMGEDGSIAFREDVTGAHALFILPLDESLADPEAAQEFIDGTGFDPMFGFAP